MEKPRPATEQEVGRRKRNEIIAVILAGLPYTSESVVYQDAAQDLLKLKWDTLYLLALAVREGKG